MTQTLQDYLLNFVEAACMLADMNPKSQYNTPAKKIKHFIIGLKEEWRKTMLLSEDHNNYADFLAKMKRTAQQERTAAEATAAANPHNTTQASRTTPAMYSRLGPTNGMGAGSGTTTAQSNHSTNPQTNTRPEQAPRVHSQTYGQLIPVHKDTDGSYSVMCFRSKLVAEGMGKRILCIQCGEENHFKHPSRSGQYQGCPFSAEQATQLNLGQASEVDVKNGFDFNKRNDYIHGYKLAREDRKANTTGTARTAHGASTIKRPHEQAQSGAQYTNPNGEPLAKSPRTSGTIPSRLSYPEGGGHTVRMTYNGSASGKD